MCDRNQISRKQQNDCVSRVRSIAFHNTHLTHHTFAASFATVGTYAI